MLDREFEISTITLDGLKLNLARNKAGVTNWDDLRQPTDAEDEANEPEKTEKMTEPAEKSSRLGAPGPEAPKQAPGPEAPSGASRR